MTITYPLSLPSVQFARVRYGAQSAVGVTESPFTFAQQGQSHQGQAWKGWEVTYPPLERADAEDVVGFLLALNGREGTFLMGPAVGRTARGTWAGSPVVNGAGQSGNTLAIRGLTDGATGKAGDWLQLGSGASARLHKLTQAFTASGSPTGQVTLDLWPRLRAAPADGATVTVSNPLGLWRLDAPQVSWDVGEAQIYGVSFTCSEALGA